MVTILYASDSNISFVVILIVQHNLSVFLCCTAGFRVPVLVGVTTGFRLPVLIGDGVRSSSLQLLMILTKDSS